MPTTDKMRFSNNYTRQEVYDAYRSKMCTLSDKYIPYIVSSQDCGQHDLQIILYCEKYTWGIVQYVKTSRAWLKVPKQPNKRT